MSKPQLSAAIIAKNEEAYLPACLASLEGIADEVILVDTGSTDGTRRIAECAGARVFDYPWTDDFSAARNESIRHCLGEWILFIDADERLRPYDREALSLLLADGSKAAYYVLIHRRPGFTPNWQLRIFRSRAGMCFTGRIHENIHPWLDRYCHDELKEVGYAGLLYDHYGYERNQAEKARRNLPLLLDVLAVDPDHLFARCHLARTYATLGEDSLADRHWYAGLNLARTRQDPHLGYSYPYVGAIESELRKGLLPRDLIAEAYNRFPGNLQLMWHQGCAFAETGQFEAAAILFDRLTDCGRTGRFDHAIGYDARLLEQAAPAALNACRERVPVPVQHIESPAYYGHIRGQQ